MMIIWLVIVLVVLALAVAGGIWLTRSLKDKDRPPEITQGSDPAQEELRRRYAAGEIGREEYLQRKIDLE